MKDFFSDLLNWRSTIDRIRRSDERGASAIEWVVITAILVIAVSIVGAIVMNIVQSRADQLESCADTAATGEECAR